MSVRIIAADVFDGLAHLADESAHCVVTSPPYWGLRDYGVPGQIGLEATPAEYVEKIITVFQEVRRVLRKDGTCWLNLGDCYATGAGKVGNCPGGGEQWDRWRGKGSKNDYGVGPVTQPNRMPQTGLKPKDLVGMPWRIAFALQADGWWLRQDIIWSKPNPMPESIKDRCTKAHEYLFLLTKSERYYFDADAIAEPVTLSTVARLSQTNLENQEGSYRAHAGGKTNGTMKAVIKRSGNKQRKPAHERGVPVAQPKNARDRKGCPNTAGAVAGSVPWEGTTRNKRSVWIVATKPFPEAHFATFPPALIEPCIKAGCPHGGTVLDPFIGSGTTALVADRFGRNCIGIELNPDYAAMADRRVRADTPPLFADVPARVTISPIEAEKGGA